MEISIEIPNENCLLNQFLNSMKVLIVLYFSSLDIHMSITVEVNSVDKVSAIVLALAHIFSST